MPLSGSDASKIHVTSKVQSTKAPAKATAKLVAKKDVKPLMLTLTKGPHKWTFRCAAGEEALLLERLAELARMKDAPFDWFDAALVSHQLRARLNAGIDRPEGEPGVIVTTKTRSKSGE